jgi:hypothetical protein
VNLKDALGQVEADRDNLHPDGSLARGRFDNFHKLGTQMP